MKRKILFAVCTMLAGLTIFGCAKSENSESMESSQINGAGEEEKETEEPEETEKGEAEDPVQSKGTLTLEDVMNAPVTDEQYFTYRETEGGIVVLSCTCEDDIIVLPETIDEKTVVGIDTNLFAYNGTKARGIYVADTVEVIPERAFAAVDNLEILVLGTGIKVMECISIADDNNLKVVAILSKQLETLEEWMVASCPALEEIYFEGDCNEVIGIIGDADPTIYGPADSNIEKYAKEDGFTFVAR